MAEGVNIPISLDVTDVNISDLDTSQITQASKVVARDLGDLAKVINQIFRTSDFSRWGNSLTTSLGNIEKKTISAANAQQALNQVLSKMGESTVEYQTALTKVNQLSDALSVAQQHFADMKEHIAYDKSAGGVKTDTLQSYRYARAEVQRLTEALADAKKELKDPVEFAQFAKDIDPTLMQKYATSISKVIQAVHDAQLAIAKYNQTVEESRFTDEYQEKIQAIEKLKQKMEDLNQKTKEMEELGATDKAWAKAELEAKKLSTEMGSLITQARELVKTGAAFRFGDDGTGAKEQSSLLRSMSGSKATLKRNILDRSAENRSPWTEEYTKALKVIEQLEQEMDKLEEKARKLAYTGGTESQWKGLQFDVDNLRVKLTDAIQDAQYLVKAGQAFRFGDGDAEGHIEFLNQELADTSARLDSIKTKGPITGKDIAKSFQQANATLMRMVHTLGKLVTQFANLGRTSKKSSNDMNKNLKKLWKNFLMFGLGFRSMYFFVKKLRTTFINEFKLMAQVIPEVNAQVSSFMTHVNQLKGSLGTAFQPLMTVVIPALNAFIDAMVSAMNAVGKFFATLTGQGYIYKYTAYEVDYAKSLEATGAAAEKARRSLMGFDEINRLDADKEKGGGAGAGNNQEGFWEKAPTEDAYSKLADLMKKGWAKSDWTEVGDYIGNGLKESLDRAIEKISGDAKDFGMRVSDVLATGVNGFIDTPGLANSIGGTIASVINTGVSIANNFFDKTNFINIGKFVADSVNKAIADVNWDELGEMLGNKLLMTVDFAWGLITNFDFKAAGEALTDGINGFFKKMGEIDPTTGLTGWQKMGQTISKSIEGILTTITTALNGIDWTSVGQAMGDLISSIEWGEIVWDFTKLISAIVAALAEGILGWAETEPLTAAIAAMLGTAIIATKIAPGCATAITGLKKLTGALIAASGASTTLNASLVATYGTVATTIAGIGALVGGLYLTITSFWSMLKNDFSWLNEALMTLGIAVAAVGAVILGIVSGGTAAIIAAIVWAVANIVILIVNHWEQVKAVLLQVWDTILYFCEMFAIPFEAAAALISGIIGGAVGAIVGILEGLGKSISDIFAGIREIFRGIVDFIAGVFTGDWRRAWEGIRQIFTGIWDTFVGIVKAPINLIIGLINGMIKGFCTGLNFIIKGLNKLSFTVPDWVPGIGGQDWGFNIPLLSGYEIPYLAQGAVIPPNKQFLAMLGDQKSGTNVEAPLATIQQAVAEVMGDQIEAIAAIGEAIVQAIENKNMTVAIGDKEIGRAANRYNSRQNVVKGV